MEINTEINQVFGSEMAKLFSSTITEEEMLQTAKNAWQELHRTRDNWGSTITTPFQQKLQAELLKRFDAALNELLDSEPIKTDIKEQANNILNEARKRAEAKLVEEISDRIACLYTGYRGVGLHEMISDIIQQMMRR